MLAAETQAADPSCSGVRPLTGLAEIDGSTAWAMVEASPDALVMVDEHGVIELVNRQTEVLFSSTRHSATQVQRRKISSVASACLQLSG